MAKKEIKELSLGDVLPNSSELGRKPDVLFGCNTSEISICASLSIVPGLLLGVIGGFLIGFQFIPLVMFLVTAIAFVISIAKLRAVKRQKPYGYYQQSINQWLASIFPGYEIIRYSGVWMTNRLKTKNDEKGN